MARCEQGGRHRDRAHADGGRCGLHGPRWGAIWEGGVRGERQGNEECRLTILRKNPDGTWVIARDANLLAPETEA